MKRALTVGFALVVISSGLLPAQTESKSAQKQKDVVERLQQTQTQLQKQQAQITQQQDKIDQLEKLLQQTNLQLQEQAKQAQQMQNSVEQANRQASAAEQMATALNSTVTDVKDSTNSAMQTFQKGLKDAEHPTALRYKGISITPGGYLDATFIGRSRNTNSDVIGNFNSFPFDGVANSSLTEFRLTARQSRFTLLAEGKAGDTKLSGYYELDFLGQAPTANQIETNSFTPRQRQLWAQAEFKDGITLTGGQMWSLLTTDRKGIATRAEFIPLTIEGSYVIGWDYVRQTAVRFTKNFSNKTWAAFEIANPETTIAASYTPPNLFGFNNSPNAISPVGSLVGYLPGSCPTPTSEDYLCNPAASAFSNGFSTNLAPDIIAKAAFEPGWGHYEIKALGRFFRDRIDGHNNVTYGGGIGAAAVLPVVAKKADFMLEGLVGSGIGRYGASASPDVTIRPDGWIIPLRAFHVMGGMEFHPQPKVDIYLYGGNEYIGRADYLNPSDPAKPAGYGSPLVNNTNCGADVLPNTAAACGAQNKDLSEGTGGFYYRFYKGPFGVLQYGMQLEYLHRTAWSGKTGAPEGSDIVGLSSIRYILP